MRKTASLKKDNADKEKTGGKRGKQKFGNPQCGQPEQGSANAFSKPPCQKNVFYIADAS